MKNSDYWKQRFEQLETAQNEMAEETLADIVRIYRDAQKELTGEIAAWYARFATGNGVTLADAHRMLTARELEEFKWDVREYIRRGEENAITGQWAKQLENASYRYHISRLEALKVRVQNSMETLFAKQNRALSDSMRRVYESGYYHTAFELQKGFGIGWDIAALNQREVEKVLAKPWTADGYNFSQRIWRNKDKLISTVHTELSRNIALGQDPQKAIDRIAKTMETSRSNAGRLVMTEEAYFSSVAQGQAYEDLGVEQYEILATLDSHTSEICRGMDGKRFPTKDRQVGVTAPPFHVRCRSTTIPYDPDFEDIGQRAARGEDGKTYYVPADMTYREWERAFVGGGDKSNVQLMAAQSNTWEGTVPTAHTTEELDELTRYAEERGIKLYRRRPFDGDISLMKSEIDTIAKIRSDFGHTDYLRLGWKPMDGDDFGETSSDHHQIWINELALRDRSVTEKNLTADNWLAANTAEGIAAHEMGHVLSGKIKNRKTGLEIYKETVYNVTGKVVSDREAVELLKVEVSDYSAVVKYKRNDSVVYDEVISELLSVHYTQPNKYSHEFVKLLKEACKK